MKALIAIALGVILVATPTLSHAHAGLGELGLLVAVGVGYVLYMGIAGVVKGVKSSGAKQEGAKAATESGQIEELRPEASTPEPIDARCNVLPHTANCE